VPFTVQIHCSIEKPSMGTMQYNLFTSDVYKHNCSSAGESQSIKYNEHSPPSIVGITKSRGFRWKGHAAHLVEIRNAYEILVRKLNGKNPFGSPSLSQH
jgi:hypothetical protein